MRLLVTGGAGFIGSNFVLQQLGEEAAMEIEKLVVLDKLGYAGNRANLESVEKDPRFVFVEGDICDQALVSELLEKYGVTHVTHFAAESHVDRSIDGPEVFVQTNVVGTLRMLEAFRQHWERSPGKEEMRFLHVSTDEVYGSLGAEAPGFTEENRYEPNNPYSASKAGSDLMARAYFRTHGVPVIITNCSNNYGPFQFPEKLLPLMVLNALEEKPLPIYGDGKHVREWLYVGDHCLAVALVLEKGAVGETYNVGSEVEKPNIETVDRICGVLDELKPRGGGKSYADLKTFVKDRPGHDRRYAMKPEKLKRELGWEARMPFEEGLRRTIQWYLNHLDWCREITEKKYQRQRLGKGGV